MPKPSHSSAKSTHYDKFSKNYDKFNEEKSQIINQVIEKILKEHSIKSVLDMTCGTGSQVFFLNKLGYEVVGSDISLSMLEIARNKAQEKNLNIKFLEGDIRTFEAGKFDAVITIFNAIGHLTKSDFEKAICNIHNNLKPGGLYIFDINNLDYLLLENNITKLTIDWQKKTDSKIIRDVQYSTINKDGILASYTINSEQENNQDPKILHSEQTLQIYNAQQLKDILEQNGFKVIDQLNTNGSKFIENKTDCILTVAKKY